MSTNRYQLPEPRLPLFYKATRSPIKLTIRSPLAWWESHFDTTAQRTRKCAGSNCALCAQGSIPTIRYVMRVDLPDGRPALFELRERHRSLLQELQEHEDGQVGSMIIVRKAGFASNSRIDAEFAGRKKAVPISIERLILQLGLPAVTLE